MGLTLEVTSLSEVREERSEQAYEWHLEEVARANELLDEHGHDTWEPPEGPLDYEVRVAAPDYGYSELTYLRRAFAWSRHFPGMPVDPVSEDGWTDEDSDLIDDIQAQQNSHLVYHSFSEGPYAPVDFHPPIYDDAEEGYLPGRILGSSYGLRRELMEVAPLIDIELKDGELPDDEAARIRDIRDGEPEDHPFYNEYIIFLGLWEYARVSIENDAALFFG